MNTLRRLMCDVFLLCFSSSHPAVSLASDEEDGGDPSSSPSPPFTPPNPTSSSLPLSLSTKSSTPTRGQRPAYTLSSARTWCRSWFHLLVHWGKRQCSRGRRERDVFECKVFNPVDNVKERSIPSPTHITRPVCTTAGAYSRDATCR